MDRHGDAYSFGTTTTTQKCIIMSTPSHATIFAGIDWGSRSHQVCVLDAEGTVLSEKAFPHSGEGLGQLLDSMADSAGCDPEHIAVAIEVPHGPVVDSLLDRGFKVFSINPRQLDRFRDRFSPAGAKDDRRDARVLADAVRTDPGCLRALDPLDADIVKLREWSRMADEQTTLRTALTHRLRAQLWRYYPPFLALGVPLSSPWVWAIRGHRTPRHRRPAGCVALPWPRYCKNTAYGASRPTRSSKRCGPNLYPSLPASQRQPPPTSACW